MANKRSLLLAIAVISVVAMGGVLAVWHPFAVARFQGKSIREWAMQARAGDTNASTVIKSLGSNAVPTLVQMLRTRDRGLRQAAWSVAGALPRPLRIRAVPRLQPPDAIKVRQAAVSGLGLLGSDATSACPALVRALADADPGVSQGAGKALLSMGKAAIPALVAGLNQGNPTVKRDAARILGQMTSDAAPAIPALIPLLRDPDQEIRFASALSLVLIGTSLSSLNTNVAPAADPAPRSSALILRLKLDRFSHPFLDPLRDMAAASQPSERLQAMAIMQWLGLASDDAVDLIAGRLADPVPEVRLAACQALFQSPARSPLAVPALVGCLQDKSQAVREWATKAVSRYGQAAATAIPYLKALKHDPNANVSEAARAGLAKLAPEEK
jgi:HEAT repeat protein